MPVHSNAVGFQVSLWHGTCLRVACVSLTPLTLVSLIYYYRICGKSFLRDCLKSKTACIHMHFSANYHVLCCQLLAPFQVKATLACFFHMFYPHPH